MTASETAPALHLSADRLARARERSRVRRAEAAGSGWVDGLAPLSLAQERIWLLGQTAADASAAHLTRAIRLRGRLDVAALERGIDTVVRRHEALRTTFVERDGRPWQALGDAAPTALPVSIIKAQVEASSDDEWAMYLRYRMVEEARRPFDLARGPLLRGRLLRVDPQHHLLLLTAHRLVCDERSLQILLEEAARVYPALAAGQPPAPAPPPPQFAAFAARQRQWLASDAAERQLAYWKRQLADLEPAGLLGERSREAARSLAAARLDRVVSGAVADRLRAVARGERATSFMTLLAAWLTLLAVETGRRDVAAGVPVDGRAGSDADGLIGCCANTLVFRADLGGDPSYLEIVRWVRRSALDAYAHQDLPYERVAAAWRSGGNRALAPLVATTFAWLGQPAPPIPAGPVTMEPLLATIDPALVDLAVSIAERDDGLGLTARYASDRFDQASIAARLDRFVRLLEAVAGDPTIRLAQLGHAIGASAEEHGRAPQLPAAISSARPAASVDTPTEAAVADIWRQTLDVASIDAADDFFDLGGHSVQAAQVVARLREALGMTVPMRVLFESPTLAAFARRLDALRAGAEATTPAAMVMLQPGGARPPVFVVPGGAGGGAALFRFAKLARHIGPERPFFGFLATEVDEDGDPQRWVETTAAAYVRELRLRQPEGPWLLLGGCVGGILTLAMAQRLQAEGERPPHLLLLDSRHPAAMPSGSAARRAERDRAESPDEGGLRAPRARLLNRSSPAPYAGRITLLANDEWLEADPTLGWHDVARGGLAVRRLPGGHGGYLRDHTAALADLLRPLLDQIESEAEHAPLG